MKAVYLVIVLLGGLLATSFTHAVTPAAQLKQIRGSVLIHTGETYKTANEGANLFAGDSLMVMEGSSMVLVYQDSCVAEFKENQVVTVKDISTCKGGAADVDGRRPLYAEPLGGSGQYGASGTAARDSTGAYVVGGIALVGLGAALTSSDDSDGAGRGNGSGEVNPPISAE